jgi:hypothetical protein
MECISKGDINNAFNYISASSIRYYDSIADDALYSTFNKINTMPLIDHYLILCSRVDLTCDVFLKMGGKEFIIYAYTKGWLDKNISHISLKNITITGDKANAEVFINNNSTGMKFDFDRENGLWKFNILSEMTYRNKVMETHQKNSGISKKLFLFTLVNNQTGKIPDDTVYQPLLKDSD